MDILDEEHDEFDHNNDEQIGEEGDFSVDDIDEYMLMEQVTIFNPFSIYFFCCFTLCYNFINCY